jgi:hypothetical protein
LSDLRNEILLRLGRVLLAGVLGAIAYVVMTGPLGEPGSPSLALLCFVAGAAVLQILSSNPL